MKRTMLPLVVVSLLFPNIGAFAKDLENIPLVWKPTSALKPPATMTNVVDKVTLEPFADKRKLGNLIAENREKADKGQVLRVTTKDNVAAFVTENFGKSLEQAGFTTTSGAERSIGGELRQFFVTETGTYKGEITLKMWVKARQGQVLWNGVITGRATRWGKSYKAENYHEVLSDSLINAVNGMLANPEVLKALTKR